MPVPSTATSFVATSRGRTDIALTWTDGANTDAQLIYRHTADVFASASAIGSAVNGAGAYVDLTGVPGSTYYYWLLPIGSGGVGTQTSSVTAATLGATGNPGTDIVAQIIEAMVARLANQLPSDWHRLKYARTPDKNDKVGRDKGYAAIPGASEPGTEAAVFGSYTQKQTFTVVLSKGCVAGKGDTQLAEAEKLLYQWMDRVIRDFKASKLYEADVVVRIADPSIDAPEYFEDDEMVVLRANFPILYRNTLS